MLDILSWGFSRWFGFVVEFVWGWSVRECAGVCGEV